ncbi:MAG: dTMP kinase [Chloroflexi bacterium]|nr:dTMP kinase [Chloroflexota bacterium]
MALFITFEGGDGCGKSVQARALYRRLARLAVPVVLAHEPGGTPLGQKLARVLKWGHGTGISPMAELLMFNASRAQLVDGVIQPGLKSGKAIVCDRYVDSTIAYQSYGRGLELETVDSVCRTATGGLTPDLTVLLDIPPENGLARKGSQKQDRFEQEGIAFHRRVRQGYLELAAIEPARWLVIDALQSKTIIAGIIWHRVSHLLSGTQ